jgi:hypothetical protein
VKRTLLAAALLVTSVFGVAGCGSASSEIDALQKKIEELEERQEATSGTAAAPTTTGVPLTAAAPTTTGVPLTAAAPTTTGVPSGPLIGSRSQPVLIGDGKTLSDGWSLAIRGVKYDAAAEILAKNMFNESPEPGRQFVLVDLMLAYNGFQDPKSAILEVSFNSVGQSNVAYGSLGCGILPNELDRFSDVFTGGSVSGKICFDVLTDDVESLVLYASAEGFFGFDGDIFFSLHEESESPSGLLSYIGPVSGASASADRLNPNAFGAAAPIGGGWHLTVNGFNADGTAAVLAENQFNDTPPDGHVFYLVDVTVANEGLEKQDSSLWVDIHAVGVGNVEYGKFDCGIVPDELDRFSAIFPGGSVRGNVCFVVPESEATSEVVLYATGEMFGDEMVYFGLS